ncbi:hypothetical protein NDR87_14090 [Nocardia sp. CDC159]|uniref:Uncharacterized protein n=1 Tax=Nocardia pulmonis TaxID=2951408 RepID=A0A9X2IZ09_9NOCA|nr:MULTISPECIES: hypothetical protein [Nocardia]MCM6774446.1 hypothetical protein [Nocardia pulmonis]MCM6787488.1 hypothetical protein [Nocardia sp. CDC159]
MQEVITGQSSKALDVLAFSEIRDEEYLLLTRVRRLAALLAYLVAGVIIADVIVGIARLARELVHHRTRLADRSFGLDSDPDS